MCSPDMGVLSSRVDFEMAPRPGGQVYNFSPFMDEESKPQENERDFFTFHGKEMA